jgi:hypothetical protein
MLYTILYFSNAKMVLNDEQLSSILNESVTWNGSHNITGFLAYIEGVLDDSTRCQFIQVLEGTKSDVEEIFAKIKLDSRHGDIKVIKEGHIINRKFGLWKMGFERLHFSLNPILQDFFSMNPIVLAADGNLEDNVLMQFMRSFYNQEKIIMNIK